MGIQINGQTDTISASDGSLVVSGQQLTGVTDISASGIITATQGYVVGTGASIFSPAANTLALGTNGSERVRVDSSGNFGVGTGSPGSYAKLSVFGTQNVVTYGDVSAIFSDGVTGSARFHHSSGSVKLSSDSALVIGSGASATEVARFLPGGGLTFNGDTAAANALDDYEEGTWTPVVSFGGASVGITGIFSGTYTKVGNVVTVCYILEFSSKGSSTGAMTVTGLPFSAGVSLNTISGFGYVHRLAAAQTAGQLYMKAEFTTISFNFAGYSSGNTTLLTDADIANTTDLRGGMVYRV